MAVADEHNTFRASRIDLHWGMNRLRLGMTVALGVLLLNVVFGQELWAGTQAGMTPHEVLELVPNAEWVAEPSGPAKWPDMLMLVEVVPIEVLGVSGRAAFGFIDEELIRVALSFLPELERPAAERQCAQFRAALRGRYGAEGSSKELPVVIGMSMATFAWFSGLTEIELNCFISPTSNIFTISYHYIESSGL